MHKEKNIVKDEHGKPESSETKIEQLRRNSSQKKGQKIKLQNSEAWYRALFNHANDAIFLMDYDRFIDCNPKTLEMFGCTKEQIIGQKPYDRFSPKFQPNGQKSKDKALEKIRLALEGKPQRFEWRHFQYHGKPFEAEVSLNRVELLKHFYLQAFVRDITKQKHRNMQYELILKLAMDGFGVFNKDGNILEVNDAYCKMVGYSQKELLSMNISDVEALESADEVKKHIEKLMNSGSHRFETRHKRKDGKFIDLEVSANNFNMDGHRLFAFFRDITESKKSEQAVLESEMRYRSLFENMPVVCFTFDRDGRFLSWNHAAEEIYGYTEEEAVGASAYELIVTDKTKKATDEVIQNVFKGKTVRGSEWQDRDKYGKIGWRMGNSFPLFKADGSVDCGVNLNIDITERKRTETALAESEQRFRKFFEYEPEYCYMISPEGVILEVNSATLNALGYTKEELIGKPIKSIYAPESQEKISMLFKKWKKTGEIRDEEIVIITKGGEKRTVLLSSSHMLDENNNLQNSISIQRDITGRKQAEEELKESEQRYRLLVEFASDSIFLMNMKGNFIDVNPAACDSLGRSRKELLNLSLSDINRDWPSKKLKSFLRELAVGKSAAIEGTHNRKNKTSFPVEIRLTKIDVDEGQVVLALARDITQRRRIEESLRRNAETVSHEDKVHVSGIDIEWDHAKGVCSFENLPVAMMWIDTTLAGLMSGLQAMVGAERFGLALQSEGRKSVEDDWRVISQFSDFERGFKAIANIASVAGWGDWKLIEIDTEKKECLFRVWNSWEGLYQKVLGVNWGSGMLGGKLAGYCSMLFKENCWADQTSFIAEGDNFDEFRVHISNRSIEKEIENLLATDKATRADMAVALQNLRTEISMREVVELALGESEKTARALLDATTDSVLLINRSGLIIDSNDKMANSLGRNRKEIIGSVIYDHLPHDLAEKRKALGYEAERQKTTITFQDQRDNHWFENSVYPIFNPQGEVVRFAVYSRDITERKDAEKKLQQYQEQLKSLASELSLAEERERRRIAAGIHDDIAQRLALAKLELQSMQNSISDSNIKSLLKRQCITMDRIMEDARSLTFELSNPLLYEIGLEVAIESFLMEQIKENFGIKCKFISKGPQISLNEDIRIILYQGVRELLTNIIKHANASRVEVHIIKNNTQISISVKDDGIGLNPSKLGSPEREKGGFGLFNIRERLEYLGGNLNVQSKPNRGTYVTMNIPLKL